MLATEFASKCIEVAQKVKTLYVYGGWGQPLNQANKNYLKKLYKKNATDFAADIDAADDNTFAFDCVCFVKSMLDGFKADKTKTYGGATYGKPCPDITIQDLLNKYCVDISTNLNNIMIGEFIVSSDYGHCGIYVGKLNGKRMVAESTYNKSYNGYSGVQLIDMDRPERKNMWKYHGKLWQWMDYNVNTNQTSAAPTPITTDKLKSMVNEKIKAKKGDKNEYVKEIQRILISKGFACGPYGADGDYGLNTEKAVKAFQTKNQLTVNGIVDYATIIKLIG